MVATWTLFKSSELIPVAGKYRCVVCSIVVDIPTHFIERGTTFFACPVCKAGEDGGAKAAHEDVWEYLG